MCCMWPVYSRGWRSSAGCALLHNLALHSVASQTLCTQAYQSPILLAGGAEGLRTETLTSVVSTEEAALCS